MNGLVNISEIEELTIRKSVKFGNMMNLNVL